MTNSDRLSDIARQTISDESDQVYVSAAGAYELTQKVRIGKWEEAAKVWPQLKALMSHNRFTALAISIEHGRLAGEIAHPHWDPFDRLVAAQAIIEGLTIVTIDPRISEMGAKVIW